MRLAFDNGQVYVPYKPGIGDTPNYAQEFSDSGVDSLSKDDPGSKLTNFAAGLPSAAMTGAATAQAIGGGKTGPIIGGVQAGVMAIAPLTGPAAPFVLMAASLIGPIASMFKGCGTTCTQASKIADDSQRAADQIMARYKSEPIRYYSIQQAALAAMADIMRYIEKACGSATLGAAGQRCISERLDPNACVIKDAQGGCHNFWIDYINPIKNDPTVVPDPVDTSTVSGKLSSMFSGLPMPLILGGAGLLVLLLVSGDSTK